MPYRDDAEKAKDEVTTFDGRKIFVHYADRKPQGKKGRKKAEKPKEKDEEDSDDTGI